MKKINGRAGALFFRALWIITSWAGCFGFGGYLLNRALTEIGLGGYDPTRLLGYFILWGIVCGLIEAVERIDFSTYSGHSGSERSHRRGK